MNESETDKIYLYWKIGKMKEKKKRDKKQTNK